jgi:hypothetical protein
MRAINHALTGALIGLVLPEPLLAIPLSLASHFVLDALPHSGVEKSESKPYLRSKQFRYLLYADALACFLLVAVFAIDRPLNWLLACICALAGAAPDFASFKRWRRVLNHKKFHGNSYTNLASRIQWFERPIGWAVELSWLIAGLFLISPFFR